MNLYTIRAIIIHRIKEIILLLKYYRWGSEAPRLYVSRIDNRRNTFGLTDRLKGIISLYALSKAKGVEYKCTFTHPFRLEDFLECNCYNWLDTENKISSAANHVRVLISQGEDGKRLIRYKSHKQLHAYVNRDYLELINQRYNQHYEWGTLFNELFRPTEILQNEIDKNISKLGPSFIACVFRFQSLLGDFKEYNFPTLENEEQETLIQKCTESLVAVKEKYNKPILVTSDSYRFLKHIEKMESIHIIDGKVVHLDCSSDEEKAVYLKSFIDFMVLSKADRIFSIGTKDMYPTEFPKYAARLNHINFDRILI